MFVLPCRDDARSLSAAFQKAASVGSVSVLVKKDRRFQNSPSYIGIQSVEQKLPEPAEEPPEVPIAKWTFPYLSDPE